MLSFNDILIFMRERAAKRQELRLAGEVNRSNITALEPVIPRTGATDTRKPGRRSILVRKYLGPVLAQSVDYRAGQVHARQATVAGMGGGVALA